MKRLHTCYSAVFLMGYAALSLAASTTDLTIKGTLTPAACTPELSRNGFIDFGKISRQDLNPTTRTRLRDESLDLSIHCTAPARFALLMRDNRDGSALVNSEIYYGLNLDHSGNKIGLYSLHFDPANTVIDDWSEVFRTDSTTGGKAWSSSNGRSIPIGAQSYLGFTNAAGSNAGPIAIQTLNARVILQTVIAPTAELDLSRDVQLDGSATLDLVYL